MRPPSSIKTFHVRQDTQPYNYPLPTPRLGLREATRNLGLYNPYLEADKSKNSFVVALMWLGFAVVGLMVTGLMIFNVGIGGAIVGAVSAIIPAGFYLTLFLWLDRYDPEPPVRLIFAFVWGAVIAIFIAYIVNTVFGIIFGGTLAAIVSAPIIEEGGKGGCVLIIALFFRRDFDGMVDGIVYAGVVALGFATVENISYYGESMVSGGTGGLFRTLILRGVLSPYSHVLFTCMTGVGIGIARETHDKALKIAAPSSVISSRVSYMLSGTVWPPSEAAVFFIGYLHSPSADVLHLPGRGLSSGPPRRSHSETNAGRGGRTWIDHTTSTRHRHLGLPPHQLGRFILRQVTSLQRATPVFTLSRETRPLPLARTARGGGRRRNR